MKNILIILSLLLLPYSFAHGLTLSEIQDAIKSKGAKWTTGDSWVWSAPSKDKKMMMGTTPVTKSEFSFMANGNPYKTIADELPQELSWLDHYGINYMGPVTNQGKCGSCVAFASIATLMGQLNVTNQWPNLNMDLAEQHIWACGSGRCDRGWQLGSAARLLKKKGVADEACFPYVSGAAGRDLSCSQACADSSDRSIKLKSYKSLSSWSLNTKQIMEALQDGPLMGRMTVYADFVAYKSGIYEHVAGSALGGHAITIVGYNNIEKYWLVKNSWGEDWGNGGYFKIKMDDDSGVGVGSYKFNIDPFDGIVKIAAPGYREVISGNYEMKIENSFEDVQYMTIVITGNGSSHEASINRTPSSDFYRYSLNTEELSGDGIYEAQVTATLNDGSKKSSKIKRLFVLNEEPTIEVVMNNMQDGATVSDRVYIDLTIRSYPIPLEKLLFKVKNADGSIRTIETTNIDEKTILGWRTYYSPNGACEIWAEGKIGSNIVESRHFKMIINN